MPKNFSFVIFSFSFVLAGMVFNRPQVANASYPVMPSSEVDVPFCYMEMGDGRRVDLRALCRTNTQEIANCFSGTAGMPISNVRYDGNLLTGQVTNRTCKTVQSVKVNYQVLDNQGNELDNGYIDTQPSTLPQGKTASFGGAIAPGAKVNVTHIDWSSG